ncbi:hypothetical protein IVB45_08625 [Bradyrhizobium sp. 4]|uniref:hypothetical protein n=1 Tax=unclassified Bradyrhizobium TaxID=2631580 RepID=UPI001FF96C97|nr:MULTISPECIES: hypothetical protein [unclassified Bradyrhizobium]MCK1752674.1 hypothetical protein [Bradyrhizobium sp. 135]UPJ36879.1 hypothetical protein IVB45_08625 [Bradyrhizobium sp. 4]
MAQNGRRGAVRIHLLVRSEKAEATMEQDIPKDAARSQPTARRRLAGNSIMGQPPVGHQGTDGRYTLLAESLGGYFQHLNSWKQKAILGTPCL